MSEEIRDLRAPDEHLAWFLGPKAEHAALFEQMILLLVRDYLHWRLNYFPDDKILLTRSAQRALEPLHDTMHQKLLEMCAGLRRNFPFYSPRYIGHMLSDTTMPSLLGYLAGMLYNPNNITTEAAPVTVEWELDACNELLEMLGFRRAPLPRGEHESEPEYLKRIPREFGWAHTTFDGSTATLEALWVARAVKYLPLAIKETAKRLGLPVVVRRHGDTADTAVTNVEDIELLLLNPGRVMLLLESYLRAACASEHCKDAEAAWHALRESPYDVVTHGVGAAYSAFPPRIFATGAAHYILAKAADVLGLGAEAIVRVPMGPNFRMDVGELRGRLLNCVKQRCVPLAVIGIAGTTEEGAVDPLHSIWDVRRDLERTERVSFWLHVDAAWGGYIRSLFNLDPRVEVRLAFEKLAGHLQAKFVGRSPNWYRVFSERLRQETDLPQATRTFFQNRIDEQRVLFANHKYRALLADLEKLVEELRNVGAALPEDLLRVRLDDRVRMVQRFVHERLELVRGSYRKPLQVQWGDPEICAAFIAMGRADSIVCDPHKMGYGVYPCGLVAFRDNRVRYCVRKEAPYITAVRQDGLTNLPPRRREPDRPEARGRVIVEAFAPFILEGSRPGAAAAGLWLATQVIPPTMLKHGRIVRSSLLAARELYEWLMHWDDMSAAMAEPAPYILVPFTPNPPDTNVVTFAVAPKGWRQLRDLNALTNAVYGRFSIQAELGAREHSYGHPFFLSKTPVQPPAYSPELIRAFLERCGISDVGHGRMDGGVTILRAVVMNPYLNSLRRRAGQDLIREFVEELARAARAGIGVLTQTDQRLSGESTI